MGKVIAEGKATQSYHTEKRENLIGLQEEFEMIKDPSTGLGIIDEKAVFALSADSVA